MKDAVAANRRRILLRRGTKQHDTNSSFLAPDAEQDVQVLWRSRNTLDSMLPGCIEPELMVFAD